MVYYIMDTDTNSLIEACASEQEAYKIVEEYQKEHKNVRLERGGGN